jgi:hypothetical protein
MHLLLSQIKRNEVSGTVVEDQRRGLKLRVGDVPRRASELLV